MANANKKPLLKSDIEKAMEVCRSAAECARFLDRSYTTFRKYAEMYGLFEACKNQSGFGISKGYHRVVDVEEYRQKLVDGNLVGVKVSSLRDILMRECILDERCAQCGYNERRWTDQKVPLLLDFLDGDKTNRELDNLQLLCYNCFFLTVGNFVSPITDIG